MLSHAEDRKCWERHKKEEINKACTSQDRFRRVMKEGVKWALRLGDSKGVVSSGNEVIREKAEGKGKVPVKTKNDTPIGHFHKCSIREV